MSVIIIKRLHWRSHSKSCKQSTVLATNFDQRIRMLRPAIPQQDLYNVFSTKSLDRSERCHFGNRVLVFRGDSMWRYMLHVHAISRGRIAQSFRLSA